MHEQPALQTALKNVRPTFPLSYPQERLWFQYLLEGPSGSFNYPVYYRIKGNLDRDILVRSLEKVFENHEIFRSRFTVEKGDPRFFLAEKLELSLDFMELSSEFPETSEEKEGELIALLSRKIFDLEKETPFRITLIRVSETYHILMLNFHHIIMDGISIGCLDEQIRKAYEDLSCGTDRPLPGPESPYTEQVLWQRRSFSEDIVEESLSFWQEYLENSTPLVDFPMDTPKRGNIPVNTTSMIRYLPKGLCDALKVTRQDLGVSRFIIVLSTFYAFLYSYTGQKDLIAGCATSGRFDPSAEKVMGFFANTLPVRVCPDETMSLEELVLHVHNSFQQARSRELPYQLVVRGANPDRLFSHTPLFNVGLSFFRNSMADLTHGGISFQGPNTITFSSGVDLLCLVYLQGEDMLLKFNYSPELFREETIEKMMDSWLLVLETLLEKPELELKDIPFIVNRQIGQYHVHDRAEKPSLPFRPLHELISQISASSPHSPALILSDRIMSYSELNYRSNLLADHIVTLGLDRHRPVGICMERSMEMVISLLAVMKAGSPWIALDPSFPGSRLSFMLEDSSCSLVLAEKGKSLFMPGGLPVIEVDTRRGIDPDIPSSEPGIRVMPDDLAYIIYTSGSTGTPKGVMIEHSSLWNYMMWHRNYFDFTPGDITLLKTPFTFDASLWEFFAPLMTGGSIVILEPGSDSDMEHIAGLIKTHGITMLNTVPAFLDSLLDLAAPGDLDSLRNVLCGAEAWKVSLLEKFNSRSTGTLHNVYGPTETTLAVTCWSSPKETLPPAIPMGEAIAGARLYILDEKMRPLPPGVPGELYVAGPGLARGYLNSPDLEKEKFIIPEGHPFEEKRFYRTGDLVKRLPGGDLVFLGRVDDQVK
ncbi:MAG: amino acid adenylation domain-containing protein, partial [Synergistales bacterium]|nr:amino acid adenylation domain-containing protein [Synergistales bacterium]